MDETGYAMIPYEECPGDFMCPIEEPRKTIFYADENDSVGETVVWLNAAPANAMYAGVLMLMSGATYVIDIDAEFVITLDICFN